MQSHAPNSSSLKHTALSNENSFGSSSPKMMTVFGSSSCCWSPSLLSPVSGKVAVVRSVRCSLVAHPRSRHPGSAGSAPQAPEFVFSSILAPIAACLVLSCAPAEAGILSGSPGLESFPFPSLPTPEYLKKIQEDEKARYEGLDAKFKSSPYVQELLKRSEQNAEKHRREIQNKYCQRGADWGVGDCSVISMSEEQRSNFMEALKGPEAPQ